MRDERGRARPSARRSRRAGARAHRGRPPAGSPPTSRCSPADPVRILPPPRRNGMPMPHSTDDRRFRLPTHVRPVAYDAALSLDLDAQTFTGTLRLDLSLAQPAAEIILHAHGLSLSRAHLRAGGGEDDAQVSVAAASETVTLRFRAPVPTGPA